MDKEHQAPGSPAAKIGFFLSPLISVHLLSGQVFFIGLDSCGVSVEQTRKSRFPLAGRIF